MTFRLRTFQFFSHGKARRLDLELLIPTSTNTTTQPIHTNITVEGEYNKPIHISVSAVNCAGTSGEVVKDVYVGVYPEFYTLGYP